MECPTVVLVTGATSAVGGYLLPALQARGVRVRATSRGAGTGGGALWLQGELTELDPAQLLPEPGVLLHLAPIFVLPALLPGLIAGGRLRRLVALSSTSVLTKPASSSARERALARRLAQAEAAVIAQCTAAGVPYTLLRPTVIYGGARPGALERVAGFIRRFGFFPLAGAAAGLRQPVHAEDVAQACLQALLHEASANRVYEIPGGETLNYREMLRRMFLAQQRRPRLLTLPVAALRLVLACARLLPHYRDADPAMAERMNQDLVFDGSAAARDFGFRPRGFSGTL